MTESNGTQYPQPYTDYSSLIPNINKSSAVILDDFLPPESLLSLTTAVNNLEADFHSFQHWQEDRKFYLELVDPYRYPYIEGITQLSNKTKHSPLHSIYSQKDKDASTKFQLLPTDITINTVGSAHFASYVNSLHPRHKDVIQSLEEVTSLAIPLVEEMFQDLLQNPNLTLGRELQASFSVKSLYLPADKTFLASKWHTEGFRNDKIIATIIYYFDVDNISESKLSVEHFNPVQVEKNRIVVIPNIYKHRVDGFSVDDGTKIGRRRTIVIFLVDPNSRVLSTSDIPPQQGWWKDDCQEKKECDELGLGDDSGCCYTSEEEARTNYFMIRETELIQKRGKRNCNHHYEWAFK